MNFRSLIEEWERERSNFRRDEIIFRKNERALRKEMRDVIVWDQVWVWYKVLVSSLVTKVCLPWLMKLLRRKPMTNEDLFQIKGV